MREANGPADELALQALLYASDELNATEADAFERRLADDQSARDALSRAVCLNLTPPRPDPAYRDAVRRRLRPGLWGWLLRPQCYRGHPAVWTGAGAAAAVLLTLHLVPAAPTPAPEPEPPSVASLPPAPAPESEEEPDEADVAEVWADLNGSEHLARAREEEMRRRTRVEERSRYTRGEDRRGRPLHNTSPRR